MRKKTFLKAVSIFVCFSILMLSVPGVIAAEKPLKQVGPFKNILTKIALLFPFLNVDANVEKDDTSDTTSDNNSNKKIKITGTLKSRQLSADD